VLKCARGGSGSAVDDGMEIGIDVGSGAGFASGLRAEICTGAGVCECWGVYFGFSSWGVQVGVL
jgi:hypothetical protein